MCFEHPAEYPSTFVRECQVFNLHCVSRVETLDEKNEEKNPLNFVISPTLTLKIENSMILLWHDFVVLHEKQPVYFIIISAGANFFLRMLNWDYSETTQISHCFKEVQLLSSDFKMFIRIHQIS